MNKRFIKKLILLIIGNICILIASRIFPSPTSLSFSEWLGNLIFSPFSLLGAVIFFIVGFLVLAFLIKAVILEGVYPFLNKKAINKDEGLIASLMILAFLIQIVLHPFTGGLAVIFAISYGIMEANEGKGYDSNS